MKILVLVDSGPHPHNYGVDHLCAGLYAIAGAENVFDWPAKPSLHLASIAERDECDLDSDACLPSKGSVALSDIIPQGDVAIIACQPDDPVSIERIKNACKVLPRSLPIACIDMSDHVQDLRAFFENVAGRPLTAYFKRELPIGAQWDAIPCPLSYPAARIPFNALPRVVNGWQCLAPKVRRVFYHGTSHGTSGPGLPRMWIVNELRRHCAIPELDIGLYPGQAKGSRPSPEEYHAMMAESLITFSWNGLPHVKNWDCNRFWESLAYGLVVVAERPRIQIPDPFVDGEHLVYVDDYREIPQQVRRLLDDEIRARRIAANGQAHFLSHHTSERRAAYVLEEVKRRA